MRFLRWESDRPRVNALRVVRFLGRESDRPRVNVLRVVGFLRWEIDSVVGEMNAGGLEAALIEDRQARVSGCRMCHSRPGAPDMEMAAWVQYCQILLCANEFLYVD